MRLRLLVLLLAAATSARAAIDPAAARRAFGELRAMCDRDAGNLWCVRLCGPTLFVERGTRAVAADTANVGLKASDGVFTGTLPKEIGIANTAVDWGGTHWTMVVWPLPEDAYARRVILAHESWHRVQEGLGFPLVRVCRRPRLRRAARCLRSALDAEGDGHRRFRRPDRSRVSHQRIEASQRQCLRGRRAESRREEARDRAAGAASRVPGALRRRPDPRPAARAP